MSSNIELALFNNLWCRTAHLVTEGCISSQPLGLTRRMLLNIRCLWGLWLGFYGLQVICKTYWWKNFKVKLLWFLAWWAWTLFLWLMGEDERAVLLRTTTAFTGIPQLFPTSILIGILTGIPTSTLTGYYQSIPIYASLSISPGIPLWIFSGMLQTIPSVPHDALTSISTGIPTGIPRIFQQYSTSIPERCS